MMRVIIGLARIRGVVVLKKKNDNFKREIVKYRFAEKLKTMRRGYWCNVCSSTRVLINKRVCSVSGTHPICVSG